jgi:ABC-type protease/lipase transport system fused ATPase/permease subunit
MLQVFDRVLTSHDENTLLGLSLIALFIYLVYGLLERARGWILIEVAEALDARISPILHRGLLSLKVPAELREGGALNDLNTVKQFVTGQPILSFLDAPWAIIYLIVIFFLHPALGWLSLFSMTILCFLALLNQHFTSAGLDRSRQFSIQERRWVKNISFALDSIHVLVVGKIKADKEDLENVFTTIYNENLWSMGQNDSKCGVGSSDRFTKNIQKIVKNKTKKSKKIKKNKNNKTIKK